MKLTAHRYHDFSYGHRVVGHEGKCRNLHGHNGRVTFYVSAPSTDEVGRVIDFSVIKSILCEWLEKNWDHRFLVWESDPFKESLLKLDKTVVVVPFNPTAENLATYLVNVVGPEHLPKEVCLERVDFEETRKCGATITLPSYFSKC